jgi:hypothetical protein
MVKSAVPGVAIRHPAGRTKKPAGSPGKARKGKEGIAEGRVKTKGASDADQNAARTHGAMIAIKTVL